MGSQCVPNESGGAADGGDEGTGEASGGMTSTGGASGGAGPQAAGGAGNEGGAVGIPGPALTWEANGWIDGTQNPEGIQGWWWFVDDCNDAGELPCLERDAELSGPDGADGWSTTADTICVRGTVEPVTDFSKQWGGVFGFNLSATLGGDLGPYDASAYKGFAVDITGDAPAVVDILLEVIDMGARYRRGFEIPIQDATVAFSGAEAPIQDGPVADRVPIDTSQLAALSFVILPNGDEPNPFDFCVGNIRVLE
jgi:hypothetical protein